MLYKSSVTFLSVTSFLVPITFLNAQENSNKACSMLTQVGDSGEVIWAINDDLSQLLTEAKELGISAADYQKLCAGEDVVQEASAEEDTEESLESDEELAGAETTGVGAKGAAALLPLAALGGGGGGGGGGSSSTFLDESTTFTYNASLDSTWTARQEYKNVAQYTVSSPYTVSSTIHPYTLVGVNYAYGMGLSGSGETIAIVDNGYRTTHEEFADKISASKLTNYNTLSTDDHGTHVAGIAAGDYNSNNSNFSGTDYSSGNFPLLNYGTMGVAYNANLHLTDYDVSVTELGNATTSASNAGAVVQNNSWGWGTCTTNNCSQTIDVWVTYQNNNGTTDAQTLDALTDTEAGWRTYLSALDSFQSNGIIVVAAGNDSASSEVNVQAGLPQIATELAEAWLVVGNIDTSGSTVTSGSVTRQGNQCGITAEYCVQADGTEITQASSSGNSGYAVKTGTSMAAPIVSGTVALLAQAFPNHTPEQLTDRILASANNDFFTATGTTTFINGVTHGYNAEFGHGIVDLSTALQPIITSSMIPPSDGTGRFNARYGNINTARRFDLSSSQVQLGSAFGDSLSNSLNGNKAYFYDALNGGFAFDIGSLVKSRPTAKTSTHSFESVMGGNTITNRKALNGASFMSDSSKGNLEDGSLMAFMPISKNSSSFVGNKIHIQNAMNFTRRSDSITTGVNSDSPFNIPFLQASEQGTSVGNKLSVGDGRVSLGLFSGESKDYGMVTSGFVSEYGREIGNSYASLFIGLTNENDGFLETSVEGAFAEDSSASTTFSGISGYGWLNDVWSYNALGSVGSTQMSVDGVGLLSDIENITSSSFAFEAARPLGLNDKDSFHIGLSQPLRVENGNATISIPRLYETNGNLSFDNVEADLSPSGRQLDLNLGYQASLNNLFNVGIQMAFSQDYGHIKSDEIIHSAAAFMKFDF
jgi:subtilisin family serine protease